MCAHDSLIINGNIDYKNHLQIFKAFDNNYFKVFEASDPKTDFEMTISYKHEQPTSF